MRTVRISILAALALSACLADATVAEEEEKVNMKNPTVIIETGMGDIQVELWLDKAPKTVANFLKHVDDGFYDGLIFHRVIDGFMIQGGGLTPSMETKETGSPIQNEASAELKNLRGTIAMARTGDPHSATNQFFINVADNDFLNHKAKTREGYGYAVFGRVTAGMDVVEKIKSVKTVTKGQYQDVPAEPVVIKKIRRAEKESPVK